MLIFYLAQCAIPLALVFWLWLAPPRTIIGFWTQSLATALGIVAIGLVGLWVFPPWWVPWVLACLLVVVIVFGLRRYHRKVMWPEGIVGWIGLISAGALGVLAANQTWVGLSGRNPPQGEIIDIASPLGPGTYLVANGGNTLALNAHYEVLHTSVPAHAPWIGEAFAVDLVAIDAWGLRATGAVPALPDQYRIFGTPVIAPCDGQIVVAVDGLPDMIVPEVDPVNLAGNHVFLRCGGYQVVMGHFKNGSLRLRVGDLVKTGAPIAQVGNSGNTGEPHLHIHVQRPGTTAQPFSGTPIPIRINGHFLIRNQRFTVAQSGEQP